MLGKCLLKQIKFPLYKIHVFGLPLFLFGQQKNIIFFKKLKEVLVTEKPQMYCSHLWCFKLFCVPWPRTGNGGNMSQQLNWKRKELKHWWFEREFIFHSAIRKWSKPPHGTWKVNLYLETHLSELWKPITYLLKGKRLCIWTITPCRGKSLPERVYNCLDC